MSQIPTIDIRALILELYRSCQHKKVSAKLIPRFDGRKVYWWLLGRINA